MLNYIKKHAINAKKILQPLKLSWTLRSGLYVEIKNYTDWLLYNEIFTENEYDIPILKALELANNEKLIFLDVGANVGFFTLRLAHLLFKTIPQKDFEIILIEGSPSVYKELMSRMKKQLHLNKKIKVLNYLVGEHRNGTDTIYELDFHASSTLFPTTSSKVVRKSINVPYIDALSLLEKKQEINLLKCDIEGAEQLFIKNYQSDLLPRVKCAVFEFNHDKSDFNYCRDILRKSGFIHHQQLNSSSQLSVDFFWK